MTTPIEGLTRLDVVYIPPEQSLAKKKNLSQSTSTKAHNPTFGAKSLHTEYQPPGARADRPAVILSDPDEEVAGDATI
jgi:hypothetical protein